MLTDRDYHEMDMADAMADVREAKDILARKPVAELRALACKYFHFDAREARNLTKTALVDELALEHGVEIINEAWRNRRKPKT